MHQGKSDIFVFVSCSFLDNVTEDLWQQVLELESTNVKALYRRAQAYISMSDLDLAELDIKKALEIDPNNRLNKISVITSQSCAFYINE